MPYSSPAGNAADFIAIDYLSAGAESIAARIGSANYAPQDGLSVAAVVPTFISPAGNATDFVASDVLVVSGSGAVSVAITADGTGSHELVLTHGDGTASVDVSAAGLGAHGVLGSGAISVGVSALGDGVHAVAGEGAASCLFGVAGFGIHERYELAGEVRLQGVLVNRQVRAYRRDTGALVGEATTNGGRFRIPVGFTAGEHYIIPIDLDNLADDFAPPCANRVMSVLAMDAA